MKYMYGDVYWVDLNNKCTGDFKHKQVGIRPCVIVSNDCNNHYCDLVSVIPLTTKRDFLPQHKKIFVKGKMNYVLPEQILTIEKKQLLDWHYHIYNMTPIQQAMKIQFNL